MNNFKYISLFFLGTVIFLSLNASSSYELSSPFPSVGRLTKFFLVAVGTFCNTSNAFNLPPDYPIHLPSRLSKLRKEGISTTTELLTFKRNNQACPYVHQSLETPEDLDFLNTNGITKFKIAFNELEKQEQESFKKIIENACGNKTCFDEFHLENLTSNKKFAKLGNENIRNSIIESLQRIRKENSLSTYFIAFLIDSEINLQVNEEQRHL